MRTPRTFCIKQMTGGGEYVHFGVKRGLKQLYNGGHLAMHSTLQLQFGIDGLALYKSSNTSLWPILCSVKNISNAEPFVVGVFCGRSKPASVDEFLADFVAEVKQLVQDGVQLTESHFEVTLHSFVCDSPVHACYGEKC